MEDRYLICIDIDGTLLNEKYRIPTKAYYYLKTLIKAGHLIVLASGRPPRAMMRYYYELGLDTPTICYNGALLLSPNSELKSVAYHFKINDVLDIYSRLRPYITNILCEVGTNIYVSEDDSMLKKYFPRLNMHTEEGEIEKILKEDPMACVMKLSEEGINNHEEVRSIIKEHKDIEGRIWTRIPYVELFYKGVDKGKALKKIMEYYGIDKNHTIAIGDSENDIGMFKCAKYRIAMANGKESVKNVANYVTEYDNNKSGFVPVLKTIIGK